MGYMKPGAKVPEKGKGSKLTHKQAAFVEEYLIDLNASQAILRAGYKTRNQDKMGTQLLQHPLVKEAVEARLAERRERTVVDQDYVLNNLVAIVEDTKNGNPNAALRGLELLGKHLGLYRDKQEISGPDGGAIEMEQKKVEEDVADFTSRIARLAKRNGTNEVVEFPKRDGEG